MATVKSTLKGINRSSLTNNADLIECQDLINLRFKEGKWKNVKAKTTQFAIGAGVEAMCVHNTSTGSHIVIYHEPTGKIRYRKSSTFYDVYTVGSGKSIRFETIGNFLVVFDDTSKQMFYILWDIENSSYRNPIDQIPELIKINFSCWQNGSLESFVDVENYETFSDFFHSKGADRMAGLGFITFRTEDASVNTAEEDELIDSLMLAKFEEWQKSGMFNGFVMIRYAYELYDGSVICYSEPIIMYIRGKSTDKYSTDIFLTAVDDSRYKYVLGVRFLKEHDVDTITVLSIDAGKIKYNIPSSNASIINKLQTDYKGIIRSLNIYMTKVHSRFHYFSNREPTVDPFAENVEDQRISPDTVILDSQLYKIYSIPLDKLSTTSPKELTLGDINNIQTNPVMPTEELGNIKIYAKSSIVYNSRIWLGNITSYFPKVYSANAYNLSQFSGGQNKTTWFEFELKTAQGNINVKSEAYVNADTHLNLPFCLYYPDSRAIRFNILVKPDGDNNTYICFSEEMYPHPIFNYSYCFIGYLPDLINSLPSETATNSSYRDRSTDNGRLSKTNSMASVTWKYPTSFNNLQISSDMHYGSLTDNNRVQVSSVNNPMYFEAKNSYRVGNGTVLSFMSNARPLTQLQFGQHPMFVFTSTGVFALEIGTGEVMVLRVAPVTDEVITGSPTAYNGNVIFPTDKGIFALYGDSTKLISQALHGEVVSNLANNEAFLALYTDLFGSNDYISQVDFIQYLNGSKLAVDYINEELIVSNPTYEYSYIFNLESKVWSKRSESFKLFSNSWPTTYATIERNGSVDLVELGKESGNLPVLVISRPSGFGSTDDKKIHHAAIRTVISGNTGRITGLIYGQMNEEGLIFLNNGKSVIQSSLVDLHLSKTSRSCRYTVLVFGCKPTQLLLDRLDCEVENSWGG